MNDVTPPATAARLSEAMVAFCVRPGSQQAAAGVGDFGVLKKRGAGLAGSYGGDGLAVDEDVAGKAVACAGDNVGVMNQTAVHLRL